MTRTKLILMLVAGLVLYFSLSDGSSVSKRPGKLIPFLPSSCASMEVSYLGGGFSTEQGPDGWVLANPKGAFLDVGVFSLMVNALFGSSPIRVLENVKPDDVAQYGLVPPDMNVILRCDNVKGELLIGRKHPVTGHRYAKWQLWDQVEGAQDGSSLDSMTVSVIDDSLYNILHKTSYEVREHSPFSFDVAKAKSLTVAQRIKDEFAGSDQTTDGYKYVSMDVMRSGSGCVVKSQLVEYPCDVNKFEALLSGISGLKVGIFVDDFKTTIDSFGLAEPDFKIVIWLESGDRREIYLGKGVGEPSSKGSTTNEIGQFAKAPNAPWIYKLSTAWPEVLQRGPQGLSPGST